MKQFVSKLPPSAGAIERTMEQVFEQVGQIERDIQDFLIPLYVAWIFFLIWHGS
ncbi:hypothetical protein P4S72_27125 [Vibrio sp. PP-XX7]